MRDKKGRKTGSFRKMLKNIIRERRKEKKNENHLEDFSFPGHWIMNDLIFNAFFLLFTLSSFRFIPPFREIYVHKNICVRFLLTVISYLRRYGEKEEWRMDGFGMRWERAVKSEMTKKIVVVVSSFFSIFILVSERRERMKMSTENEYKFYLHFHFFLSFVLCRLWSLFRPFFHSLICVWFSPGTIEHNRETNLKTLRRNERRKVLWFFFQHHHNFLNTTRNIFRLQYTMWMTMTSRAKPQPKLNRASNEDDDAKIKITKIFNWAWKHHFLPSFFSEKISSILKNSTKIKICLWNHHCVYIKYQFLYVFFCEIESDWKRENFMCRMHKTPFFHWETGKGK